MTGSAVNVEAVKKSFDEHNELNEVNKCSHEDYIKGPKSLEVIVSDDAELDACD